MEGFPQKFVLNHSSVKDNARAHGFEVQVYDGKSLYSASTIHFKYPGSAEKTGTLKDMQSTLWRSTNGSNMQYVQQLGLDYDRDHITWSVKLPIKDRDGNEVSIDFANISHIGYNVAWEDYPEEKAIQHREVETFEVSDDGGLKSMGNRRITEIVQ